MSQSFSVKCVLLVKHVTVYSLRATRMTILFFSTINHHRHKRTEFSTNKTKMISSRRVRNVLASLAIPLLFSKKNGAVALSTSSDSKDYLNSLLSPSSQDHPVHDNTSTSVDLENVMNSTPDDHYAKEYPGAGWAGYKHPLFGGYLDALATTNDEMEEELPHSSYLDSLPQNQWKEGKQADYGDDVRWGAQVYLDAI